MLVSPKALVMVLYSSSTIFVLAAAVFTMSMQGLGLKLSSINITVLNNSSHKLMISDFNSRFDLFPPWLWWSLYVVSL